MEEKRSRREEGRQERREEEQLVEEERSQGEEEESGPPLVCRGWSFRRLSGIHVERLEDTGELFGPCCQCVPHCRVQWCHERPEAGLWRQAAVCLHRGFTGFPRGQCYD